MAVCRGHGATAGLVCALVRASARRGAAEALACCQVLALPGWPREESRAAAGAAIRMRPHAAAAAALALGGLVRRAAAEESMQGAARAVRLSGGVAVFNCDALSAAADLGGEPRAAEVDGGKALTAAAGGSARREEAFAGALASALLREGVALVVSVGAASDQVRARLQAAGVLLLDSVPLEEAEGVAAAAGATPTAAPLRALRRSPNAVRVTVLFAPRRYDSSEASGADQGAAGVCIVSRDERGCHEPAGFVLACAPTELAAAEAAASAARCVAALRAALDEGAVLPGGGAYELAVAAELRAVAEECEQRAAAICDDGASTAHSFRAVCLRTFAACFEGLVEECLRRGGCKVEHSLAVLANGRARVERWKNEGEVRLQCQAFKLSLPGEGAKIDPLTTL